MGIARMIGVDTTLGDPNSFGASIVFALPIVVALWKAGTGGALGRWFLLGYVGLSSLCILLTGSRSSLLGLLVWFAIIIWGTKYRFKALVVFAAMSPIAFVALPESLQTRFETIINPEVRTKSDTESGEGRWYGLIMGLQQWANNPLTGIGPGAWRPANNTKIESHNLYGQLLGETGTLGGLAFLALHRLLLGEPANGPPHPARSPGVAERSRFHAARGDRGRGVPAAVHGELRAQPVPVHVAVVRRVPHHRAALRRRGGSRCGSRNRRKKRTRNCRPAGCSTDRTDAEVPSSRFQVPS